MPQVYDQEGRSLGAIGVTDDTRSFGAAVWEFLHPGQVQAEARAVGAPVPSYGDIWSGASADAATAAAEAEAQIARGVQKAAAAGMTLVEVLVVGLVALVALQLVRRR